MVATATARVALTVAVAAMINCGQVGLSWIRLPQVRDGGLAVLLKIIVSLLNEMELANVLLATM